MGDWMELSISILRICHGFELYEYGHANLLPVCKRFHSVMNDSTFFSLPPMLIEMFPYFIRGIHENDIYK